MYMSVAGQPIDQFTGVAKEFADNFSKEYNGGRLIDPYAIYGAQSAQVMLDAIGESDGSTGRRDREDVRDEGQPGLARVVLVHGSGDPEEASGAVTAIVIYRATDQAQYGEDHLTAADDGRRSTREVDRRKPTEQRRRREGIALPPPIWLECTQPMETMT